MRQDGKMKIVSCLMKSAFESNRNETWKCGIVIDAHSNFRTSPVVARRVRLGRVFVWRVIEEKVLS